MASNHLTPSSNVSFPAGQLGLSADIDGSTTSYLHTAAPASYNLGAAGFTVEFWVRSRSLPGVNPRMVQVLSSDRSEGWELDICKGNCSQGKVLVGVTGTYLVSTGTIDDGNWHHLALTYDGATLRLYIDGVQDATLSQSGLAANVAGGDFCQGGGTPAISTFTFPENPARQSPDGRAGCRSGSEYRLCVVGAAPPKRRRADALDPDRPPA